MLLYCNRFYKKSKYIFKNIDNFIINEYNIIVFGAGCNSPPAVKVREPAYIFG